MIRGEIYEANLEPHTGSEQGGVRPVLIIQNDKGNRHSPTTIIAIITKRQTKAQLPTHVWLPESCGLPYTSMVELEQIRTIDKSRIGEYMGKIDLYTRIRIDEALKVSLGINWKEKQMKEKILSHIIKIYGYEHKVTIITAKLLEIL